MNMNQYRQRQAANDHMWMIHEHQRLAHYGERSPKFMGYTAIPLQFVLRTVTGIALLKCPSQPELMATETQAHESLDIDNFCAELNSWAGSEPK